MKILIVHDRSEVSDELADIVEECNCDRPQQVRDTDSAKDLLAKNFFDLVIIDLTLPKSYSVENHVATYDRAAELTEDMYNGTGLNPPGGIIGITKEASALQKFSHKFEKHLLLVIDEDADGEWKASIKNKIGYLARSKSAGRKVVENSFDFDVAIVCALDKELAPFEDFWELFHDEDFKPGEALKFQFRCKKNQLRKGVAISLAKTGQHAATSVTQSLITHYRPKLCLMSGICGGVKEKVKIGDVVFFKKIADWDSGKWIKETGTGKMSFVSRPNPISIYNTKTHRLARSCVKTPYDTWDRDRAKFTSLIKGPHSKEIENKLRISDAASGTTVVANEDKVKEMIVINEDIDVVDMESYGLYYASRHTQVRSPEFICIKAVTDFCDDEKNNQFQKACSFLSAKVSKEFIGAFDYD